MPKYKVPAKRKVVKTVRMSNGSVLTGEVDARPEGNGKIYWFKDHKYITPYQQKSYKFYDKSLKAYRTLSAYYWKTNNTTPVYQPAIDYLSSKAGNYWDKATEISNKQAFKSSSKDALTLRTKKSNGKPGLMNLVDTPLNLLDSIAVNAGRSGTDFWTDMALVGKESTFGGYSKALTDKYFYNPTYQYHPHDLTNNHAYFQSPENDYMSRLVRDYDFNTDQGIAAAEKNAEYALKHGLVVEQTPHYSLNMMADAFKRYQMNPTKYNPGQKNYVPVLNGIRNELIAEPQLQDYWNTQGKEWYSKGKSQGMAEGGYLHAPKPWDDLSLSDKSEVMRVAVSHGITTLPEIKDKWNEFAEGGDMDKFPNDLPEVEVTAQYPYEQRVIDTMNNSSPEFLERLRNNDRRSIHNPDGTSSTHVLGSTDNIVFPSIVDVNGQLIDNRSMPWESAMKYAIDHNDYIEFPTEGDARYFGEHYKKYFPEFFGNTFRDGGYKPSSSIMKDIANWEGSSMKTNRSFEAEARDFNRVIPRNVMDRLSQEQLDALYSYGYNVGMGNLKKRVLPTLTAYTQGRVGAQDVANSMKASRDNEPGMGGLRKRRAWERNMFTSNTDNDMAALHASNNLLSASIDKGIKELNEAINAGTGNTAFTPPPPVLMPPSSTDYGVFTGYDLPAGEPVTTEEQKPAVDENQKARNNYGMFVLQNAMSTLVPSDKPNDTLLDQLKE